LVLSKVLDLNFHGCGGLGHGGGRLGINGEFSRQRKMPELLEIWVKVKLAQHCTSNKKQWIELFD